MVKFTQMDKQLLKKVLCCICWGNIINLVNMQEHNPGFSNLQSEISKPDYTGLITNHWVKTWTMWITEQRLPRVTNDTG